VTAVTRVVVALMVLVAAAFWSQAPERRSPDLGIGPDRAAVSSVACPIVTGRDATSDAFAASQVPGPVAVSTSAGGIEIETAELEVAESGGAGFDIGAAVGAFTVGLLADLPDAAGAVAIVTTSEGVLAASNCTPPVTGEVAIAGMSTASGESLDLVLANPYTNDAVVEVRTISEAGVDSASELESVLVPARSVVSVDLARLLPLRNRLSIRVIPERGVVHAAAVQSSSNERAIVEAVEPGQAWFLPLPNTGTPPIVTVLPTGGVDIDFVVDAFGESGPLGETLQGTIPADQQFVLDAAQLAEGVTAVRVTTTGLSVVSTMIESDAIRAGTPGAPRLASEWLVPGPRGAGSVLRLGNPSGLAVDVVIQSLVSGVAAESVTIPAESIINVAGGGLGPGYLIRADGDIFVAWSIAGDAGLALGVGRPVLTAGE
jgi:hypothetical protein